MNQLLIVILMTVLFGHVASSFAAPAPKPNETDLKNWADVVRKSLPMAMNDELQATNIAAVGKALIYRYNFLMKKTKINNLEKIKADYFNETRNSICTNPDSQNLINAGVILQYEYYDIDNIFVMKYLMNKNTCNAIGR